MLNLTEVVIETERLKLVPASEAYAREIFENFTSEITTYMFPKPADTIDDTFAFLRQAAIELASGEALHVAIVASTSGDFIGCGGLHNLSSRTPELGLWTKLAAHGKGYGREAVTALALWALANLDFDYLIYPVDRRNLPSRKIPELLGGTIEAEYHKVNASGAVLDILEYRIKPASLRNRNVGTQL
jgi:ribosomal-protein-alanine N-acetyltransferase